MSSASNLGYGNMSPLSNVNGNYVNVTNTNNPANFGTNEIPGLPGLAGAKNNIDAAAGYVPGICTFKGGAKMLKRKIKNITRKYKMASRKSTKSIRRRIKSKYASKSRSRSRSRSRVGGRKSRRARRQRGGYAQYQNNLPLTPTYSVGGILSANELGRANPPPIQVLSNNTNCVDNYNHFTNAGFASRGH